jgi:Fe-S oxidoreductase
MNLTKKFVLFNQYLYSRPFLAKGNRSKEIFWPGCSAMKLDPEIFDKTYDIFKKYNPEMGLSTFCCSKPTLAIGSEKQKNARQSELQDYYKWSGVVTIYTLCTNCLNTLPKSFSGNVVSAWPIVAEYVKKNPGKADEFTDIYKLHDPCSTRKEREIHKVTREILDAREVAVMEFSCNQSKTLCCGRQNMCFVTNKEASEKIWKLREKDLDDRPVLTYCESCVEAFRGHYKEAYHLLEVVFNKKVKRNILNKFKTIRKVFK